MSEVQLTQVVAGVGLTAALHPFTYAKVLIQLGYEPLPATYGKSIFGKAIFVSPNIFKYLGHIKRVDGFSGLYRGIGAKLVGGLICNSASINVNKSINEYKEKNYGKMEELDGVDPDWQTVLQDTAQETVVRCVGIVASQPFQVIMVRQMAQFIGKETRYDGIIAPIKEIYNNDGILGFFSGLIPRLLCEAFTIWMARMLTQVINRYILQPSNKEIKGYTNGMCSLVVTQFTYPLSLVSNVMTVKGSGLAAQGPRYPSWWQCWNDLSRQNQLKRGSSMFWRRYPGPSELMMSMK